MGIQNDIKLWDQVQVLLKDLQADPIWGSLPAIKNGKVYIWTEEQSWFRDPIALLKQTQDLAEWIIGLNTPSK